LHPLTRLEHEQKSGVISVNFIPSVSLTKIADDPLDALMMFLMLPKSI